MMSLNKNSIVRFFSIAFCTIFFVQMFLDVSVKNHPDQKKQAMMDMEKDTEDNDDNNPEKEKEKEIDEEDKELNHIHHLILLVQNDVQTLRKQQQNLNLPSGFLKTFSPPPEHKIIL